MPGSKERKKKGRKRGTGKVNIHLESSIQSTRIAFKNRPLDLNL